MTKREQYNINRCRYALETFEDAKRRIEERRKRIANKGRLSTGQLSKEVYN